MSENQIMMEDIVGSHSDRMKNLSKYYPFFRLWDNSLSLYKDGMYAHVDMPYMTLAVIRYFIEENQFNRKLITCEMVCSFMQKLLVNDFEIADLKESELLAGYIFDKLCNDGRPFVFSWFDPADKKKKVFRVRLIESRYSDGRMSFELTEEAIAFYLDTKEIKDESRISVENVLLSKMVTSKNFKGGYEVLMRINHEVMRLEAQKDAIVRTLGHNVFEGVKALNNFFEHGLRWFEQEQELFAQNRQLVDKAMEMTEGTDLAKQIYDLDAALKMAMKKHSDLLATCTTLQMRADEMIMKAKHSRFRISVDFEDYMNQMTEKDSIMALENFVSPLFGLKLSKTLAFGQLDDLLDYKPEQNIALEVQSKGREIAYVYEDEEANARIENNFDYFLKVLFDQLLAKGKITLTQLNHLYELKFGREIYFNGDYYAFLAHLSQKSVYDLSIVKTVQDTFLEENIAGFMDKKLNQRYEQLKFNLTFKPEIMIELPNTFDMTEIVFERVDR